MKGYVFRFHDEHGFDIARDAIDNILDIHFHTYPLLPIGIAIAVRLSRDKTAEEDD